MDYKLWRRAIYCTLRDLDLWKMYLKNLKPLVGIPSWHSVTHDRRVSKNMCLSELWKVVDVNIYRITVTILWIDANIFSFAKEVGWGVTTLGDVVWMCGWEFAWWCVRSGVKIPMVYWSMVKNGRLTDILCIERGCRCWRISLSSVFVYSLQ